MSSKIIYLLPYGGLCNRINAITSCIQFAKKHKFILKIYWENNKDLSADFNDLFKEVDMNYISFVKLRWYHTLYFRARKSNLYFPRFSRTIFGINQIEDWSSKQGDLNQVIKGGRNYLSTCHSIGEKGVISAVFKLNVNLTRRLENIQKEFSTNTIGVHIRRGDHIKAIEASPITDFYMKMDKEVAKNKSTVFYLATDSNEIKNFLQERYKGKIIVNNTPLNRTSLSGMYGAVIDLWALSSVSKIIGTKYSMFSLVASEIQGIELDI